MQLKYFVRSSNDIEKVPCTCCNGTGKIIGTITSDSLDEPIKDTEISCPHCGGTGEYPTGKVIHYAIGCVYLYGTAHVEDADKSADYNLGFVCNDEQMIEDYKANNQITSFVDYPGALRFYSTDAEVLYNTLEEAQAALEQKEKEWTEPDLKVVEPN